MVRSNLQNDHNLNGNLIEKEEEVRSVRKKNDEFKKILNDKKLLDSVELTKSLEQAEKELQELKTKLEVIFIYLSLFVYRVTNFNVELK